MGEKNSQNNSKENRVVREYSVIIIAVLLCMAALATPAFAATLIVASDGSGDYTSLSAALSAVVDGDTIYVMSGTYTETASVYVTQPNITIKGENAENTIISISSRSLYLNAEGCCLENLTFQNPSSIRVAANNCTVKENIINSPSSPGINIQSSYGYFLNNQINGPKNNKGGIYVYPAYSFNIIENNRISGATSTVGMDIRGDSNIIEGNIIRDGAYSGLYLSVGVNNTISKNRIVNNALNGFLFYSPGENNRIYLNTIEGNGATASASSGSVPATISWISPEPMNYIYNGTSRSSILGNYWGIAYSGIDADGDGVGDSEYTALAGYGTDTAPLMQVYSAYSGEPPVADFVASPTSGDSPLSVQFTDMSTGSVASWAWDFDNDGVIDSTEQDPSHTYTTGGIYTVNLTVTGPAGTGNVVKNGYIAVISPGIDLTVSAGPILSSSPSPNLFAHYTANTISATITNSGVESAEAFNVAFNIDGNVVSVAVAGLGAGNSTVLSVTDSVDRSVGASVPVTVTADTGSAVAESDETNNQHSYNAQVIRNGYAGMRWGDGPDITTTKVTTLHGDIIYSLGNSVYGSGSASWTANDLPIPAGATIKDARLYITYCWDSGNVMPGAAVTSFNSVSKSYDSFYSDVKNWGGYTYPFGVIIYNVTDEFDPAGNSVSASGIPPIRGMVLVVTYEDSTATEKVIFVNEGFDLLFASSAYYTTEETATSYAPFNGVEIDLNNVNKATLTTFINRGGSGATRGTMLFNGQEWPDYWVIAGPEIGVNTTDITAYLASTDNVAGFRSLVANNMDMEPHLAILKVEYQGDETVPVAAFTANVTAGNVPLTIQFTDTSTGTPTSWAWEFGDGVTSADQDPVHTYTTEGTYTVNLTVTNSQGSDTEVKADYISAGSSVAAPVADFSAAPISGDAPLAVQFTDMSANTPTSWSWEFGDGDSTNATVQDPVHTYASAGTYTVTLTATNAGGSNSTTKTGYISGTSSEPAPVASFTMDSSSGRVPLIIHFTDTTTGSVSGWNWAFGDGGISTERNPVHTYVTAGSYTVTLTAAGPGGSNTAEAPVSISAPLTSPSYNGGIPLTTTGTGTVSGGLWYDAYPGFDMSAQKTFILPSYTDIKWARLYTVVYCGHMQNNYRGSATIDIDANGDSSYEIQEAETFNTTYSFPGQGGTGPVWINDHLNRVTSDYLMWYDLTDAITGQAVNVQAATSKIDPSFDGRIKAIVLVVAYDDGDSDTVRYWVNQGHDTVNKDDTTYTGSTVFGTEVLTAGWSSADLSAIYLASQDGAYSFLGDALPSGIPVGQYFGINTWDVSTMLTAGEESDMGYTRTGDYYKVPLALMSVMYPGTAPPAPVAGFSGTPTSGATPLTVTFTDVSSNSPTSWSWDFGDSNTSTVQNPVHTYSSAGTYTVTLTATNAGGSDDEVKTDYITVSASPVAPVAAFFGTPTSGATPLIVSFTDQSSNSPASWSWDFGDGNTSTVQNPVHTYSSAGTYTVTLTVTNTGGSDNEVKTDYITVTAAGSGNAVVISGMILPHAAPVAEFSATPTSGTAPLDVQFTDLSENAPTSWAWTFGDGGTSTDQHPGHIYAAAGTYTVTLTATNADGSDDEVKTNYISVSASPVAPVAAFSGIPTSGSVPLTVSFTDASTGDITGYAWAFGDGGTSADVNPGHTYTAAGTYTVALTVTGPAGSDSEEKPGFITVTEPVPVVDFTADATSGTSPLTVTFTATNTGGPVTGWTWDFGDGQVGSGQSVSHTYATATPATYTVSLTATGPGGSDTETKPNYISVGAATIDVSVTPEGINFGAMQAGIDETGSTTVNVDVTGGTAWAVTATASNGGYMGAGSMHLADPFQLSNDGTNFQTMTTSFADFMTGPGGVDGSGTASVRQAIASADAPGNYEITLTFTGAFS